MIRRPFGEALIQRRTFLLEAHRQTEMTRRTEDTIKRLSCAMNAPTADKVDRSQNRVQSSPFAAELA